jgi:transcriptional regulator with XRE-family HTH domain
VPDENALRRSRLGYALSKARKEAGLTQAAVAGVLGCTQGKVQKMETTLVSIKTDDLEAMIALYGLPEETAEEWRTLAGPGDRVRPSRIRPSTAWSAFGQLAHLEPDASEILSWHSERIPGPLQSEHYMLAQHADSNTASAVNLMRQRKARAGIFTIENPPRYRAILSESSLLRMPGGRTPDLAVDQAEHLINLMTLHMHLTVQILPFTASILYVEPDFEVLRFAGDTPAFAFVEYLSGTRAIRRSHELKAFEEHWQQLHDAALTRAESITFLREMSRT